MTCMERADLFLLDSVGGLSVEESAELRAHLASGCCVCAGNAAEAAAVTSQLAQLLPAEQPGPQLLERLMARLNVTPMSMPRLAATGSLTAARSTHSLARTIFAAAIAAGLAVVITTAVMRSESAEPHVMGLPDLKFVSLGGAAAESRASGRIFWDADHHLWHVYVFNLAPPPRGQQYELWFINKAGEKRAAGMLTLDNTGSGRMLVNVPADTGPLSLAAITNEPIGGSAQPTGSILLKGGLD